MTLCREVVNLIGLEGLDEADERTRVGHVAIVKIDETLLAHVAHPFVEIQMLDAASVEGTATANDAMNLIAFL